MFKERLKELRNEKKITQRELADIMKLSPSTIAMYETGQRMPDPETLERLADYFNATTDYLLGRTDIRNPLVYEALRDNQELLEFWKTMQEREDLQLMFKKSKELTPDAVRKIIEIIKLIEDSEDREYNRK